MILSQCYYKSSKLFEKFIYKIKIKTLNKNPQKNSFKEITTTTKITGPEAKFKS